MGRAAAALSQSHAPRAACRVAGSGRNGKGAATGPENTADCLEISDKHGSLVRHRMSTIGAVMASAGREE